MDDFDAYTTHKYEPYKAPQVPAQQQEPVARVINKSIVWRPCDIAELPVGTPLYTSPQPSKPWVGLTRPEIAKLSADAQVDFCLDKQPTYEVALTRAIEAKLREKNA